MQRHGIETKILSVKWKVIYTHKAYIFMQFSLQFSILYPALIYIFGYIRELNQVYPPWLTLD